jgi:hypothetical protein
VDAKIPSDVSFFNTSIMQEKIEKTREEIFQDSHFEWVKTERQGDVCRFKEIVFENDIEYVVFIDNTRVRTDLIGDVVLAHQHPDEILGIRPDTEGLLESTAARYTPSSPAQPHTHQVLHVKEVDPVLSILEKTKKRTEKVSITLTLKIPAPELYNVIKENFDNVEDVLLQNVMDQIHDNLLRDALKKELQNIYQKRKRNNAGSI